MKAEKILQFAAVSGALTVVIGAFGAHGLKPLLDPYQLNIFEKGVQYQFYHTLALTAVGILNKVGGGNSWFSRSAWFYLAGIVFFSGSLYLLACKNLVPVSTAWVGPVTPLGGLCFIAGWVSLGIGLRKSAP